MTKVTGGVTGGEEAVFKNASEEEEVQLGMFNGESLLEDPESEGGGSALVGGGLSAASDRGAEQGETAGGSSSWRG